MATSRSKPTDVMLRELIRTMDRQQHQIEALTEAIHRMASSNEEVVAILGETLQDNIEAEEPSATSLDQVLDDIGRGFT